MRPGERIRLALVVPSLPTCDSTARIVSGRAAREKRGALFFSMEVADLFR
jgi:hypothetical protein